MSSFPLLSLPHAVLAQHVWPQLSPWGRAQLRGTCKELRGLADGLIDGTMQLEMSPEVATRLLSPARTDKQHKAEPAVGYEKVAEEWRRRCALLARTPRVQSLELAVHVKPIPKAIMQQLRAAAGGRITRLKLDLQELKASGVWAALAAIPLLCPNLKHLAVAITYDSSAPAPLHTCSRACLLPWSLSLCPCLTPAR